MEDLSRLERQLLRFLAEQFERQLITIIALLDTRMGNCLASIKEDVVVLKSDVSRTKLLAAETSHGSRQLAGQVAKLKTAVL